MKNSKTRSLLRRSLLLGGLIASLGASLSWNPEHFGIARYDMGLFEMDLASRKPQQVDTARIEVPAPVQTATAPQGFDLGQYDGGFAGVQARIATRDGNKVKFYIMAGERCDTCYKEYVDIVLSDEEANNPALMERAMAEAAIAKFKDRIAPGPGDRSGKRVAITSECDEETDADQTSCQYDEFMTLVESCDSGEDEYGDEVVPRHRQTQSRSKSPRDNCTGKAKAYFKKFLGKSMAEALQSPEGSDDYIAAIDARDAMLTDLSGRYSEVKKVVLAASAQGVLTRARVAYNAELGMTQNTTVAMMKAKNTIAAELYGSNGANLCSLLTEVNCAMAFRNPAMKAQLEVQNKNYRFFADDFESGLKAVLDYKGSADGVGFDQILNGQIGSPTTLGTTAPADLYAARTTGVISRESATPIPGTGQVLSIPNSLPQATGQVVIPGLSANPNNQGIITNPTNNFGTLVPGQVLGNNTNVYDPMNPTGINNNANYPRSPGQQ